MSRKPRGFSVIIEEAYPISLRVMRTSRGLYRWEAEVKGISLEQVEDYIHKLDEWCRERFESVSQKAEAAATPKPSEAANPLPEIALPIRYREHDLGKVILGHDRTTIRISDSYKVKLEDPAISKFLIQRVINPLCEKYNVHCNTIEKDGYLREIVIDKPLFGKDAERIIESARWAITKAFSKPLEKKGGEGRNE